jgi:hypothetical protein
LRNYLFVKYHPLLAVRVGTDRPCEVFGVTTKAFIEYLLDVGHLSCQFSFGIYRVWEHDPFCCAFREYLLDVLDHPSPSVSTDVRESRGRESGGMESRDRERRYGESRQRAEAWRVEATRIWAGSIRVGRISAARVQCEKLLAVSLQEDVPNVVTPT